MGSTDAIIRARPSTAFRFYFPIQKSDGTPITATWTGIVVTISIDGAVVVTNVGTLTQIASLGMGYIDFTSGEIGTAKNLSGTVTVTNVGAAVTYFSVPVVADADNRSNLVNWLGSAPNALQSGRVDSYLGAILAGVIASGSFAANALDAVWSTTTRAITDKVGFALTAGDKQAIWDILVSAQSTSGSLGKLLKDFLDAAISGRSTYAGGDTSGVTTLLIRIASALTITGGKVDINDKTGFALSSAGIQAVWDVLASAQATSGSLGKLLLDNLNATVASRSTYAGGDTAGTTTLLGRLSATRAGYLDALAVSGLVASHADILALNQSASRRVILFSLQQWERPESGSKVYGIELTTFDGDGAAVNADSTPSLTAVGVSTGDRTGNLSVATNIRTGAYYWTYTFDHTATEEQILLHVNATIATETFTQDAFAQVSDFVAATWTTDDRAALNSIVDMLPETSKIAGSTSADGNVQADVIASLSAQGYSSDRAALIDVLSGIVAAVQAGLATSTDIDDAVTHGDATWATAMGFTTIEPDNTSIASILDIATQFMFDGDGNVRASTDAITDLVLAAIRLDLSTLTTDDIPNDTALQDAAQVGAGLALLDYGAAKPADLPPDPLDATATAAAVQVGLTAQGYNPTRAVLLDKLSTIPHDVWNFGMRTITAIDETIFQAVWDATTADHDSVGTFGYTILNVLSRMIAAFDKDVVYMHSFFEEETLRLVQGDDYTVDSGREIPHWTSSGWPDLTSAVLRFKEKQTGAVLEFATNIDVADLEVTVSAPLTRVQSATLLTGSAYRFGVIGTTTTGKTVTLARGEVYTNVMI